MSEIQNPKPKIQSNSEIQNPKKRCDLRERLFAFAKQIIQLSLEIPKTTELDIIKKQLSRSGTSIGANYEEADGSLTRRDLRNRIAIARKEAKEAKYWLRLSADFLHSDKIPPLIKEANEIICILSAILFKIK